MRETMTRILSLTLLSSLLALSVSAQEVEWRGPVHPPIWTIDEEGEFVTITYGLSDSVSKTYDVTLQLTNIEQKVLVEPEAVTGHVGTVRAGPQRKIIWHYRKDYPAGLRGRGWKFILTVGWDRQKLTFATREGTFTPPRLRIDRPLFVEANRNGVLDAGEQGEITFTVYNGGIGEATGTTVTLSGQSDLRGLRTDTLLAAGDIPPGGYVNLHAVVSGAPNLQTGLARVALSVQDRFLYSVYPDTVNITTQAFLPPALEVTNRWIQSVSNPVLRKVSDAPLIIRGDTSTIVLQVKNRGRGKADSLRATVFPEGENWNVHFTGHSRVLKLLDLPPDSSDFISFSVLGDERAEAESIYVRVAISERRPTYGIIDTIRLPARRRFLSFDAQYADLMKRRMFDSAGALCRRQMVVEPHRASLYASLGAVYESLGDQQRAVSMYATGSDRGDRVATAWLAAHATCREVTSVRYESLPLPFLDAGTTVTLGVFPAPPAEGDSSGERLYNTLRSSADRKRLVLVPYRAMISQLGVKSLSVTDAATLGKASRDLDITYLVDARDADKAGQAFTLSVTRTSDAQVVFTRRFQKSSTSTALQDVAKLFKDSMVPLYDTKRLYSPKTGRGT
jgi:hypothetical protein